MYAGSARRIANDAAFVLIGADLPVKWLGKVGVSFVERPHSHQFGATDELVERLVGKVATCSSDAHAAVAQVRGLRPEPASVAQRVRAASARWLDSAVALLPRARNTLPRPAPDSRPTRRIRVARGSSHGGFDSGCFEYEAPTIARAPTPLPPLDDFTDAADKTVVMTMPPEFC